MPKYKVKSAVSVGTTADDGKVTSKDYKAGDSVELTEEQAASIGFALEDAPVDESIPESTRLRPDHKDSGVAAAFKVDGIDLVASEARARQNVLDSPSAEFSDGSALAEDLEEGASDNVARRAAPKRTAASSSRTGAPAASPTTTQPPAAPKPTA
jgi:hypothetical protein